MNSEMAFEEGFYVGFEIIFDMHWCFLIFLLCFLGTKKIRSKGIRLLLGYVAIIFVFLFRFFQNASLKKWRTTILTQIADQMMLDSNSWADKSPWEFVYHSCIATDQ